MVIFLTDVKVMKNNTKPYLADRGELGKAPGMLQAILEGRREDPVCLRNCLRVEPEREASLLLWEQKSKAFNNQQPFLKSHEKLGKTIHPW